MTPPIRPVPEQTSHARPASAPDRGRLPGTVRALGWTSFFTDLSSEAIYPLLPGFVRSLGGGGAVIGLIDGLATTVAAVVRLPSGMLSDRVGRRPLVLFGYGISAAVRPLMGLVGSPFGVLVVRAADRFGKGIRTAPRDALVVDMVAPDQRGQAFGHIRALDHAGAALGPLVAMLFLLACPGRERLLFLLAILPGLLTLAVIWRFVHDPPRHTAAAPTTPPVVRLSRPQAVLLGGVGIWALGASSEQFLLLRAGDLGVPQPLLPLVWFGMSVAKTLAATGTGRLADRIDPRRGIIAGWLAFAAAYAGLSLTTSLWIVLPLLVLVGVAYGIAEPAERALVAALASPGSQGRNFGWYALAQGLMALPAGLLAGWLWEQGPHGAARAFGLTAVLSLVACCLILGVGRRAPVQTQPMP